ncbi:MAG: carboxylating nicotinate-nucleotide diphosphorylase [Longimicrobiales bacterium]
MSEEPGQPAVVAERAPLPILVDETTLSLIDLALAEDCGPGDWTSQWVVHARTRAAAEIASKAEGVVAGLAPAVSTFLRIDPRIEVDVVSDDGASITPGDVICRLKGPARALLTGERVALNYLQHLSGVATLTRRFVDAIAGTGARILDTRKTLPGWRVLEKAAVRAGGGENHRMGLYDAVLVKDNHIALAGDVAEAIARVREQNARGLPVIVEVHDLDDIDVVLDAGADRLLLDNFDIDGLRAAVRHARARDNPPELEASGNVTLERVRDIAETGVDFISVGALTHSARALDLSMRIVHP